MLKSKIIVRICVLTALMLLSACVAGSEQPNLAESSWQLIRLPGYADLGPVDVSLVFGADGSIGGIGGCNSYGGAYQANAADGTIKFSEIFSTEMYCESNNASQIESAFFQTLNEAQSYSQSSEGLSIDGPSGSMKFVLAPEGGQ